MLKVCFVLLTLVLTASPAMTQSFAELFDQANKAYEKKDYEANVQLLEKAIAAGADHPTVLYFLARGYALTGNAESSVKTLNQLAKFGLSYHPEKDSNFAAIHQNTAFLNCVQSFQMNMLPTSNSSIAITIEDSRFVPEGIAYDEMEKTFYFGGIASRQILRFKDGKFSPLSNAQDGLWSVLGMKVDPRTRTLWAASTSLAGEDKGKSGIFHYDLKKGHLLHRYILTEGEHGLGDVVLHSDGRVSATDSSSPAIYLLKDGKLELFLGPEPFRSPQGACLSEDEKVMFVADYSRGIFAVELDSRKYWKLSRNADTTVVAGIDGLYCYNGSLIAIQNGVQPNRILQIFVSSDRTKIDKVDVLESNHKVFPEPTLGAIVGSEFYYIGNSMIGPYLDDPKAELKPALILKLPLNRNAK